MTAVAKSTIKRAGGLELFMKSLVSSDAIRQAVNQAANVVRNTARRNVRAKDKSGREYYRPAGEGKSKKYKASAPGEAPARFTGHLANHIRTYPAKKTGRSGRATAWVGATSPHAHLLEYGTVKMAARPFMGPAARQSAAANYQNIKAAAKRTVKAAAAAAQKAVKNVG